MLHNQQKKNVSQYSIVKGDNVYERYTIYTRYMSYKTAIFVKFTYGFNSTELLMSC